MEQEADNLGIVQIGDTETSSSETQSDWRPNASRFRKVATRVKTRVFRSCVDGMIISVRYRLTIYAPPEKAITDIVPREQQRRLDGYRLARAFPRNALIYRRNYVFAPLAARVSLSGVLLTREMGELIRASDGVRTFIFPRQVRSLKNYPFCELHSLRSVIMNSAFSELQGALFAYSDIRRIMLSSGLKKLGSNTFLECDWLKTVIAPQGCVSNLRDCVGPSAQILLPDTTVVFGQQLPALRRIKELTIPEGVVKIEACWFQATDVQRVNISASVREIGFEAFRACK